MEVIWSEEAVIDYNQNLDYLLANWSERVAIEFIDDVSTAIELIQQHPELFPLTDFMNVRRAVIRKQISLYFKVDNQRIYLIRFWNNYKDPKNLEL